MNLVSKLRKYLSVSALALVFASSANAALIDVELSLVIDVSGSVSTSEYNLQMDGYATAFRNAAVQNNITNSTHGIAVNVVFFASNFYSTVLDTFTILNSAADANAFADVLDNFARPGSGGTAIYNGLNRAVNLLLNNGLDGKSVIDVSGDGTSSSANDQAARDNAVANNITVNGLAIGGQSILNYYTNNVIGGTDAFVNNAATFADFEQAVINKIQRETRVGVPEPSVLFIFALGLITLSLRNKYLS